jgi:N-acetylglucosamine malate deacetylase 1
MRALFILAHADDEYFCQPLIARELAAGRDPYFAYMTDGAWKQATSMQRSEESLARLSAMGVPRSNVRFPGVDAQVPVGGLHRCLDRAGARLSACLAELPAIGRAYVCAWEGGHHDHDCCYALAVSNSVLAASGCEILQFPLYHGSKTQGALFKCLDPLPENGPATVGARFGALQGFKWWLSATAYPSQWRSWVGIVPMATVPMLFTRIQWVQACARSRLSERPHVGRLYYERRFGVSYQDVAAAIREL